MNPVEGYSHVFLDTDNTQQITFGSKKLVRRYLPENSKSICHKVTGRNLVCYTKVKHYKVIPI